MANDRVISKNTFGNHGLVIPDRESSLKTDGGLMYYSYDGMRNVTELTDRHGDSIEQYRYDAKANLIDMNARWYGAQNGRFTTADPYTGDILTSYTQNRYVYVGNNPINRWDPLGYWEDSDSGLSSATQADIRYLTDLYYATEDEDERESLHEADNEIRRLDRDRWTTEDERKIGSWSDDMPDIDYETPIKLSDGWRTDWTRIDKYYVKYEVTASLHTGFAGVISTTVSNRTDTTTTVTNGFDFRAFTPSECYQENKAVLRQYDIPIPQVNSYYEPKDAYSKTTSSSRSITSTKKIVSRNDNNNYKNGIISQGIEVAGVSDKIVGIDKDKGTSNDVIDISMKLELEVSKTLSTPDKVLMLMGMSVGGLLADDLKVIGFADDIDIPYADENVIQVPNIPYQEVTRQKLQAKSGTGEAVGLQQTEREVGIILKPQDHYIQT
ncbi:MAG: RHS repeat-associated core domain-containing protein [Lutisporaceae bacterium]